MKSEVCREYFGERWTDGERGGVADINGMGSLKGKYHNALDLFHCLSVYICL